MGEGPTVVDHSLTGDTETMWTLLHKSHGQDTEGVHHTLFEGRDRTWVLTSVQCICPVGD